VWPFLANRFKSRRCKFWSVTGHCGHRAARAQKASVAIDPKLTGEGFVSMGAND
jgi:hypothetical protein